MTKAEQVLTANFTPTDEPLELDDKPFLEGIVLKIANAQEGEQFVRNEAGATDYKVYWNEETEAVRVAVIAPIASYEVPKNVTKE